MATQTLTRLYDNHTEAVATVQALEAAGFGHDHIAIVTRDAGQEAALGTAADPSINQTSAMPSTAGEDATATDIGAGASVGTIVGGSLGLLAGLGSLFIPGIGPVVAAGWLVSTLTGAGIGPAFGGLGGGLVGALTHAGVPEEEARAHAAAISRGSTLVTARVERSRVPEALRIIDEVGASCARTLLA